MNLRVRAADIILIAVITVSSLLFLTIPSLTRNETGAEAEIILNGKTYAVLPLDKDTRLEIKNVGTVVVSGGSVHIENASCKDKLCEKTGSINHKNQTIICLPNKLIIRIISDDDSEVDGIAG